MDEINIKLAEELGFEVWKDLKGNWKCNIGEIERGGFYIGCIPDFIQSASLESKDDK